MQETPERQAEQIKQTELALQRALQAWILAGLAFMLIPGTYWGGLNLIHIAGAHATGQADRAWVQAHGHAQLFGWVGSFVLGIGFYSLTKMAHVQPFAIWRMWASLSLWAAGVSLRWVSNLWRWEWRLMLPVSALLELAAFGLFFFTIRRPRPSVNKADRSSLASRVWWLVVLAGTAGFFASLAANLVVAVCLALRGVEPAVPPQWNQRLLALFTWAFPVPTIWGFSARWLPVFLGLPDLSPGWLLAGVALNVAATAAAWAGFWRLAALLFLAASVSAALGLRVFRSSVRPPKVAGVHAHFPHFVRMAYGWLLVAALLGAVASFKDRTGGWWGASRHSLTVGFISTMVFAIGQRVLPAFCGMRVLYSPALMGAALSMLAVGCALRVVSEIGAYESYAPQLWPVLTISALVEMTSFTMFALNLVLTMRQPPAHLMARATA